jgi:hypothetical protein
VGALWALQGKTIPEQWIEPWRGRVGLSLAGYDQIDLDELVSRTIKVAKVMDLKQ